MYIAVDFDGTIVEHRFPKVGREVPDAIMWLKRWQDMGVKLILWTVRSDNGEFPNALQEAIDHCAKRGLRFWAVNDNPEQTPWSTSRKVYANVYIDDSAWGCPMTTLSSHPNRPIPRTIVDWVVLGPQVECYVRHTLRAEQQAKGEDQI